MLDKYYSMKTGMPIFVSDKVDSRAKKKVNRITTYWRNIHSPGRYSDSIIVYT